MPEKIVSRNLSSRLFRIRLSVPEQKTIVRGSFPFFFLLSQIYGVYVVVNFYLRYFLFFVCFNFISLHYHTQKQKKSKNYLRKKLTTTYTQHKETIEQLFRKGDLL